MSLKQIATAGTAFTVLFCIGLMMHGILPLVSATQCSDYNNNGTACSAIPGCTFHAAQVGLTCSSAWTSGQCNSVAGCSMYNCTSHGDDSGCNADAHCSWTPYLCSQFSDVTPCAGQAGCTWNATSCEPLGISACNAQPGCTWGGGSSCTVYTDAGACNGVSGCSWGASDCTDFNANEAGCLGTAGCSPSYAGSCTEFTSNPDACAGHGCTYDGDSGSCTGSYYTSCSGAYGGNCSGTYGESCSGSYNTSCTGTFGGTCGGGEYCTGTYDDPSTCTGTDYCGNGYVGPTEACDDGNTGTGDGCSNSCAVEAGWSCNSAEPSVCSTTCGDSIVAGTEQCDDGNATDNDYCHNNCTNNGSCGDGTVQAGAEQCDDGNATDNDYCHNNCTNNGSCGDHVVQEGAEACDDANAINDDYCHNDCTANGSCGDAVVQTGAEQCDDANGVNTDYCHNDCTSNGYCGDYTVQSVEICDLTNMGSESCTGQGFDGGVLSCTMDCQSVVTTGCYYTCGDAEVDPGEACDDGNATNNDYCHNDCTANGSCGDGVVQAGAEQCDDGNTTVGDGCNNICNFEDGYTCSGEPSVCRPTAFCGNTSCADDSATYHGHDYYLFAYGEDGWSASKAHCEAIGGYLTTITTSGERDAVAALTGGADQYWIGLSDTDIEGTFAWVDGEPLDFANWASGQPDDAGGAEDCVEINHPGFAAGAWNDTGCMDTDLAGFVCEVGDCGNGTIDAGEECDDTNTTDGDGCDMSCAIEEGYSCSGEPSECSAYTPECGNDVVDDGEECDDGNLLSDDGCSRLCTDEAPADCGDLGCNRRMTYGDNSYLFYHNESIISWQDAESNCQGIGGHLVSITSAEEGDAVNDLIGASQDLWLGFSDLESPGTYVWTSGEPFDYTHWFSGQPNGGGEHCGLFAHSGWPDNPLDWGDYDCEGSDIPYNYICEVAGGTGVCGDGTVDDGEQCDDDNTTSGDGCSDVCELESTCGDGVIDDGEACDDGAIIDGDGCSATCEVESGSLCSGEPSMCSTVCGDGIRSGAEACDDGNTTAGDGCNGTCTAETDGYDCSNGIPNICTLQSSGDAAVGGARGTTGTDATPLGRARQLRSVLSNTVRINPSLRDSVLQRRMQRLSGEGAALPVRSPLPAVGSPRPQQTVTRPDAEATALLKARELQRREARQADNTHAAPAPAPAPTGFRHRIDPAERIRIR